MRIVNLQEMKQIEQEQETKHYVSESLIVENVGGEAARFVYETILEKGKNIPILFLIGRGHNGADGLCMARHMSNLGLDTRAFILFAASELSIETQKQLNMAQSFGVKINYVKNLEALEEFFERAPGQFVVVDAIFGAGVRLPLPNFFYDIIEYVNNNSPFTIALDLPTGLDGNTGEMQGNAINAQLTLAIGFPKVGHFVASGPMHVGEIQTLTGGFHRDFHRHGQTRLLTINELIDTKALKRNKFADKKTFGHTAIIGGSHGLVGALLMSSHATLKIGAGLITAATWEKQYPELTTRLPPEIMSGYIPSNKEEWPKLMRDLEKYDAIVIGPGLARGENARDLIYEILSMYQGPIVIDADAINVLNMNTDATLFKRRNAPTILTPHFGEFARFTGCSIEDLQLNPVNHLRTLVDNINSTVILKGPCSFLGFPTGEIYFNYSPNEGMASGGMGDVLAGIIGGLLGQESFKGKKNSLFNRYENLNKTVALGVLIHSVSGKICANKYGIRTMTAMNVIDCFADAFKELESQMDQIMDSRGV